MVEYKLIYKLPNVKWKYFYLSEATNDMEALKLAGIWLQTNDNVTLYQLEKITTERLV